MNEKIEPRELLLAAFAAAVESVQGQSCVTRYLQQTSLSAQPVVLLSLGKAAVSMAQGAIDVLGKQVVSGLVVTRHGYASETTLPAHLEILQAGHPVPDEHSLHAGQKVVSLLDSLESDMQLLILISGGASALVEVLPEGMTLEDLIDVTQWLLASGLPIQEMNRIRQSISLSKGGKLAQRVRVAANALLISDVSGDDLAMIGSGPFFMAPENPAAHTQELPAWIQSFQTLAKAQTGSLPSATKASQIPHHLVATNRIACEAALALAMARGIPAVIHSSPLAGEAEQQAKQIVAELEGLPNGLHIWGGETTVTLPPQPGRGGRNQQLALAAAKAMAARSELWLLAAGTDGSDGNSEDTGALVDGQTRYRGETEGLDIDECLQQANSGQFLQASGDLILTGPTGTNVMDLVLAYKGE